MGSYIEEVRGCHIYIYIYYIHTLHIAYTHMSKPKRCVSTLNLQVLQMSRFFWIQDSTFWEKFLNPSPQMLRFWMSVRAWIQEIVPRILNPEKWVNVANFAIFGIQDSRFKILGKVLESNPSPRMLGFWMSVSAWIQELFPRIFNLESHKLCKVCKVS